MNIRKIRMPVGAELEAADGKIYIGYLVGYNQQKGLHILVKSGAVLKFFKDEVKKIIPKSPGFTYFENHNVMSIRTEQSQQWNPDILPELAPGESKELQFDSGPTKKQLKDYEKEIKKPTKNPPRQKTAASHWIGME